MSEETDYWENTGEEIVELPIPNDADIEYDIDDRGDGIIIVQWWNKHPNDE